MKIVVVASIFAPYKKGGAEVIAGTVVDLLRSKGHEVVVITTDRWHGLASLWPQKNLESGGLVVYRWFPWNIFSYLDIDRRPWPFRVIWHVLDMVNLQGYFGVKAILRSERSDIVLTHGLKGLGYLIPVAIRSVGLSHVHTPHDIQLVVPSGLLLKGQEGQLDYSWMRLYRWLTRHLFGSPSVVVFPSSFLQQWYRRWHFFPNSQQVVLNNPVIVSTALQGQHYSTSLTKFLYIGQLESHKGIGQLVEVFMGRQDDNWRLTIVGGGAALDDIKVQARKDARITIVGAVAHEAVAQYLVEADFVVVPSLCYENAPTVVVEAFSAGVPVVVANIGGTAELVADGVNGYIFEADNSQSPAEALARAAAGRGDWERLSDRALKTVTSLSEECYYESLERLMTKIIADRTKKP